MRGLVKVSVWLLELASALVKGSVLRWGTEWAWELASGLASPSVREWAWELAWAWVSESV